jgi:hypothetical protein
MMTEGLATIYMAIETLFFYPPEIPFVVRPPTYVF